MHSYIPLFLNAQRKRVAYKKKIKRKNKDFFFWKNENNFY